VKLTHALVRDLDEAIKEVKLLGEHGEEASQEITELEALFKRLREDAQKLKEQKATLEGMVKSRDELIMKIAKETRLDHMWEDGKDKDNDDGGDAAAPPVAVVPPPSPTPPAAAPEEIVVDEEDPVETVPEKEAPVADEVILVDVEPELPQPRLYHTLMKDYEESPSRMMDDLDDLDDLTEADYDVDEWIPKDGSNDQDWVIKSKS
jgi:hypothetical protein